MSRQHWILMSQTCVDNTFLLSGKLVVSGFSAIRLLSISTPSMMKMEVAPVSAMAWVVVIVIALRYCGMGLPNNMCAIMAIVGRACLVTCQGAETLDATTVTLLSSVQIGGD